MNTDERREQILYTLKQTNTPITGSELANIFKVSRQIIVGDITVLRASGHNIFATPRGYLLPHDQAKEEQTPRQHRAPRIERRTARRETTREPDAAQRRLGRRRTT